MNRSAIADPIGVDLTCHLLGLRSHGAKSANAIALLQLVSAISSRLMQSGISPTPSLILHTLSGQTHRLSHGSTTGHVKTLNLEKNSHG
ncbi:hypothetical protein LC605_18635 [Nostoc sp. CHAB 5836]|uniref:hypothetical protein n=1 Tax=Nostoc sp. CHAB 5836 TaxID=2780404 RepID=UPI001E4551A2|nr:hypothetical protein [Nostoc sp. CHAB 5836]MCC5617059.1 hypothetical protein [Nostoc sp. CHAB 5836]